MSTPHLNFAELVLHAEQGRDYALRLCEPGGVATVAAIHGGAIEPLTGELAEAVAGGDYNLYVLQGLRVAAGERLRIPPLGFNELRLRSLLDRSRIAVALDGVPAKEPAIYVSGGNAHLVQALADCLSAADWPVASADDAFSSPGFFFNTPTGGGAQVELSWGLRASLASAALGQSAWMEPAQRRPRFDALAQALRQGIARYLAEAASDLEATLARFEEATRRFPPNLRQGGGHRH